MQAYEGYVENGQFFPTVSIVAAKKKRAVLTILDESIKQPPKITLEELLADWDGVPFEKDDEDRAWLEMKPVGKEVF